MHIGFFENLCDRGDTMLLEADTRELEELKALFESLASGRLKRLMVHRLPFSRVQPSVELRATRSEHDGGIRRDISPGAFLWERSRSGWLDAAGRIAVLAESSGPGHQDLAAKRDEVVVRISKDEYGVVWWMNRGL